MNENVFHGCRIILSFCFEQKIFRLIAQRTLIRPLLAHTSLFRQYLEPRQGKVPFFSTSFTILPFPVEIFYVSVFRNSLHLDTSAAVPYSGFKSYRPYREIRGQEKGSRQQRQGGDFLTAVPEGKGNLMFTELRDVPKLPVFLKKGRFHRVSRTGPHTHRRNCLGAQDPH
ncbi:hypothetical cytosolic protein [Syntrophus aciditrophicus SB]|uniref:Hypothetical cytosolic protein n=1 Tax=Syntrophus aciditrophicus (strain SB) TaxID=56780 RepID=Q2LVR1_SYNAS|nr:hypothetical cytosolic protein [Syntrophus aciditrophicus SB]